MKKSLIIRFKELFKRKEYISEAEHEEIGYTRISLIEVAKKVLEEEERTKKLKQEVQDKLKVLLGVDEEIY